MHKNTFVIRHKDDRPYSKETEYADVRTVFDKVVVSGGRGVWIKARDEDGTFVGYFGPVLRP